MIIKILGSAAGGGFPQWNCNGSQSSAVRNGDIRFKPRTQSSLAVSANERDWVLFNASPDLRQQINETPELWPVSDGPLRQSPIKAVVVTNGDVDHIAGLINLREGQRFSVYGSDRVLATIAANSIFNVMAPELVPRIVLPLDRETALSGGDTDLALSIEAFAVPGKVALYLEDKAAGPGLGTKLGDTIGLRITAPGTGKSFFYIPGCAAVDETLANRIRNADTVFFDGTLYTDSEMIDQGLSSKTGARMGHISMSGPEGSMAAFKPLGVNRRIYVHINNSNPALNENSDARKAIDAAGWEVGYDGMEVRL